MQEPGETWVDIFATVMPSIFAKQRMRTKPTIYDVARHAKVSMKTVSRVINLEASVSEKTRQRVTEAIAALGWQPNLSARSLASGRSYLIGMIYDNPSTSYISELQRGALQVCSGHRRHLLVFQTDSRADDAAARVDEAVRSSRLDGVLLSPPLSDRDDVLDVLDALGVPYVRIAPDLHPERSANVRIDDRAAAAEMTRVLLEEGHRRIAFIRVGAEHAAASHRHEGYIQAMRAAGVAIDPAWLDIGDNTVASGMQSARRLLALNPRPTAIFAGNDDMAVGAMMAAYANGIQVPESLSVVGFDDTPLARSVHPQLTTVHQPVAHMAMLAARWLVDSRQHALGMMDERVEYTIVHRGSSRAVSC